MLEETPELAALVAAGREVMSVFPVVPGACVMMSALYASRLRAMGHTDARLVGGTLSIAGRLVFGRRGARHSFAETNLDWDGHAWVCLGGLIADASLLRTGRSPRAPTSLRTLVGDRFGPNQGLYIATAEAALEDGLLYGPQHTFSNAELHACVFGATTFLEQ